MKKIIFLCLSLVLLFACGYKEGVIQKSERSYLKFVGNWQNAQVQIDDLKQFTLDNYSSKDNGAGTKNDPPEQKLYQLSPDKHYIKIFKVGVWWLTPPRTDKGVATHSNDSFPSLRP